MTMLDYLPYLFVAVIAVIFLTSAIRILREYQRGVIFTLGRFTGVKGVRAIAKQAEAERLRRAKVINAEGEQQAAEKLVEAGRILAQEPQAMQLRYFAALHDVAGERSSTVVFPLPMDLLGHLGKRSAEGS